MAANHWRGVTTIIDTNLTGVLGGKTAKALSKAFGITSVDDLLHHYPRRYAERGKLSDLASLRDGESVTVLADIESVTVRAMRARRGSILEAIITDGKGRLSVTFFNQKWREREFRAGRSGLFSGEISDYRGKRQLAHPQCVLFPDGIEDDPEATAAFAGAIIPVYPASGSITSWQIQAAIRIVLDTLGEVDDPIPAEILQRHGLVDRATALRMIHQPQSMSDVESATERLKYEEAFCLQSILAQRRAEFSSMPATARDSVGGPLLTDFDSRLPFTLTDGQVSIGKEIFDDLGATHPMHRLVQGDVGSGKTLVALRAMLAVVDSGGQAALLAPTEVLAVQHHRSITRMLGELAHRGQLDGADHGTRVALLTGSQRTATRRKELLDVITGEAGIVVGTHALLQDSVEFRDLALVVVDEQHRFGVEQRAALAAKSRNGTRPHVLVMTATPIPRTIAMTVFGDLDISTLSELPAGRSPITTHVVPVSEKPAHAARVWERASEEAAKGHRVFVVCPRIGEGDDGGDLDAAESPLSSVTELAERLQVAELSHLRIGTLHGRMSPEEKDDIMRRFADVSAADGIDVLVSTTVIEVGVDVPDATLMVIMDADRFGISQLHQMRGRVGRGGLPGLCLLVTAAENGSPARERLAAVASTIDGFELSQLDLELRREGDVLGASQSGRRSSLRLLEVLRDEDVIARARADADAVIGNDPTLAGHPPLREALARLTAEQSTDYLEKA